MDGWIIDDGDCVCRIGRLVGFGRGDGALMVGRVGGCLGTIPYLMGVPAGVGERGNDKGGSQSH